MTLVTSPITIYLRNNVYTVFLLLEKKRDTHKMYRHKITNTSIFQVRDLIVYMKYDRSSAGRLHPGMTWPDVHLHTVEGKPCKLSDIYTDHSKPLLLLAASIS